MAHRQSTDFFKRILQAVFGLIFGLAVIAMGYKTLQDTHTLNSRAAETKPVVVKAWEFNGTTTEGWSGKRGIQNVYATGGALHIVTQKVLPMEIMTSSANFFIQGIKTFEITMKVDPYRRSCPMGIPEGTLRPCVTGTPMPFPFTAKIQIFRKSTDEQGVVHYSEYKDNLTLSGTADGVFHTYTLKMLDTTHQFHINRVVISFEPAQTFSADIDYMRFSFTKILPTPTNTPTPSPSPTPTLTPTLTPTPRPGCYYRQMCMTNTDCRSVMVCPNDTTETIPTPAPDITKTGTVLQDNLEGVSPYKLVVSTSEVYRLSIQADTSSVRPTGSVTGITWDTLKQYVGKSVTVTGLLRPVAVKQATTGVGIPTAPQPTIIVYTIR